MSSSSHGFPIQIKVLIGFLALAFIFTIFPIDLYRDLPHVNTAALGSEKGKTDFYNVSRVVDGDTLVVSIDGVDTKLRLIGINTPETVDPRRPVQCYGKEASAYMKSIADNQYVQLEYDGTQGRADKYDRILAYAYLQDGRMLNKMMIADGYAYEYTYNKSQPYKYQVAFKVAQKIAERGSRGLWASDTCNGKVE